MKINITITNFKDKSIRHLTEEDVTINSDGSFSFNDPKMIPKKDEEFMEVSYPYSYITGGYKISPEEFGLKPVIQIKPKRKGK